MKGNLSGRLKLKPRLFKRNKHSPLYIEWTVLMRLRQRFAMMEEVHTS